MKILNFHLMRYRQADLDAIARNGSAKQQQAAE
jgi:hypothetical protein